MEKYFSRDFDVESTSKTLSLLQHTVGDVGCVVWDAALVLAAYLDRRHGVQGTRLDSARVLELGAGTGCVGLVAAALGANVLVTDLPEMIPLIKRNVSRNKEFLSGQVQVRAFEWGSDIAQLQQPNFDMVLAADCIYYEKALDDFIKSLQDACPAGERTEILLSYEERESEEKQKLISTFLEQMSVDFDVSRVPLDQYREDFTCDDIHILRFVRRS